MIRLNKELKKLEAEGKLINVAIAGSGLMGTGLISQLTLIDGMRPSLVMDRNLDKILSAFDLAGIDKEQVLISNNIEEINAGLAGDKYIACTDINSLVKVNIDIIVDATGNALAGAELALEAIENKKDIVLLNVETDCVVGPILYEKAKKNGVIYTGTAGDEPGSAKEIYDFAVLSGFEVLAIGKGKNNPINYEATPDMVREEANKKNLKPEMLAGFVDGTNTMIEMTVMANSTGFKPDVRGGHGIKASVDELPDIFKLKSEGGVLNSYKVVEYVNGIAPGVFVIVTAKLPQIHSEMQFLKMGDGPNYILYRPYHLTSLETPITIARAVIDREATIVPEFGQVCDTVAIAKRDLKAGEHLDGIGKYTVYGTIESYEKTMADKLVPISLITDRAIMIKDVKKGELISYDMVDLDKTTSIYKLRKQQEALGL